MNPRLRKSLKKTAAFMLWVILGVGSIALLAYAGVEGSWGHAALGVLALFMGIFWLNWYHDS